MSDIHADFHHASDLLMIAWEKASDLQGDITRLETEIERLQARVAELELEEVGAKKAFGVVADSNKDLKIRVLSLEKTIGSLMTELYGKKRNDAGSDDD